jgi:hypothetical protein
LAAELFSAAVSPQITLRLFDLWKAVRIGDLQRPRPRRHFAFTRLAGQPLDPLGQMRMAVPSAIPINDWALLENPFGRMKVRFAWSAINRKFEGSSTTLS